MRLNNCLRLMLGMLAIAVCPASADDDAQGRVATLATADLQGFMAARMKRVAMLSDMNSDLSHVKGSESKNLLV